MTANMAHSALSSILASICCFVSAAGEASTSPNFVFLLGESTDGRLYRRDSPVPIPNIRELQQSGVTFDTTYANAPVCCPSRSSFLSGRYPHKLTHVHNNITVHGVWNNYEGLPVDFNATLFDYLAQNGWAVNLVGKTDWTVGGHSESAFLEAFTHNVPFPYNISFDGGWNQEDGVCASNGTVAPGGSGGPSGSQYPGDWKAVQDNVAFIMAQAAKGVPFMAYQGMDIVHPPYATDDYWFNKIDPARVTVPPRVPLADLHPCDLQASMLKGCTPADDKAQEFYDPDRIMRIRRIYYAEIAEFDAMVGAYMDAVKAAGVWNSTVFVITSDHGDQQLEHQQFYKMVPYEGSAHVPLVISYSGLTPAVITQPTQLMDLFPTILDIAGLATSIPSYVDGYSLTPFLTGAAVDPARPDYVVSQFHGDDIAMSWFMLRQGQYKYISYSLGPGATYPGYPGVTIEPQLFDLDADPDEQTSLWSDTSPVAAALEATLSTAIAYPAVAMDVAQYQLDMFAWWTGANADWREQLNNSRDVRWGAAWAASPNASLAAVEAWMVAPVAIQPCRNSTVRGLVGAE